MRDNSNKKTIVILVMVMVIAGYFGMREIEDELEENIFEPISELIEMENDNHESN